MRKRVLLSLEQALTLPYATQRFVQMGWRVIRVEPAGAPENRTGDPNRYIGEDTGKEDLHAYYLAPNLGKEAITLNLKKKEGQKLLQRIIRELEVDVFLCNTLPKRYQQLGIDFSTLKKANPRLVWCGVSAFGPGAPSAAGYDPALQAMMGYMHLTGEPGRDPMLCGLPLIDLKAGDEVFSQVLTALMEKEEKGREFRGKALNISMAQCAASWLITALPQLAFVQDEKKLFRRSGNEHRSFIPSNAYPVKDGFVYLAIGSDRQWKKLVSFPGFESLDIPPRKTNEGRQEDKENIYAGIREALKNYTSREFLKLCRDNGLAVAPVNTVKQVKALDFVKRNMMKTDLPSGCEVALTPAAGSTDYLEQRNYKLDCAPQLGEHNHRILKEARFTGAEIKKLEEQEII